MTATWVPHASRRPLDLKKHKVYVVRVWFSEMVGAAIASDDDFQAIAGIGMLVAILAWVRS